MQNIIFIHLPKNGGTTLHSVLERNYSQNETFDIKVVNFTSLNTDDFFALSEKEKNNIKLFKGHMHFGFHKFFNQPFKYITFLRKPESRIISYYYYVLNHPKHRLYDTIKNNNWTLLDFVINCNEGDVNNCQVRWISGIDDKPHLMLEKALENIEKHFTFVGCIELFDESLILLKNTLNFNKLYYKSLNITNNKPNKQEIPTETISIINQHNDADNKLYSYVFKRLQSKISDISNMNIQMYKLHFLNKLYSIYSILK